MAGSAARSNISIAKLDSLNAAEQLHARLHVTRKHSLDLARPLTAEDMVVQPADDASPTKWHLAHVTWFFETFVLKQHLPGYEVFDERFSYCFNSYYVGAGERHPRPRRGLLTRPTIEEVVAYRHHVDQRLDELLSRPEGLSPEVQSLIEIGINHEQQHQELLLTDILWVFAESPLTPAYRKLDVDAANPLPASISPINWINFKGGIFSLGYDGEDFAWDNERPSHKVLLQPFCMADRLVTNGEWLQFIEDGGYRDPLLWLADGWGHVEGGNWQAPLRWVYRDGNWMQMTLHGLQTINPAAPVTHVSYFEADAYARWAGRRLPTEFEWETAVRLAGTTQSPPASNRILSPQPLQGVGDGSIRQAFGEVWQWTASAYHPYPGYRVPDGTIGEYNGKFMVSQQVLRGSSCVTPVGHSRATYRNFFYPHQRWQFAGVRLASEVET